MDDLEKKIMEWRRELTANQVATPEALDELQSHLREAVSEQIRTGLSAERAFEVAVQWIGDAKTLRREFEKIDETPDASTWTRRITFMERDIMLPIKVVVILMVVFWFPAWFDSFSGVLKIALPVQQVSVFYVGFNLAGALLIASPRLIALPWLRTVVFATSLVDALFLCLLCLLTGGLNSVVYWVFIALIVRNSVSMPRTSTQALLNLTVIVFYALTAVFSVAAARFFAATEESALELYDADVTEQVLRVVLLLFVAVCCLLVESKLRFKLLRPTRLEPG